MTNKLRNKASLLLRNKASLLLRNKASLLLRNKASLLLRNNHQVDLPIQLQILNISVNMARIGELMLKFGEGKSELIQKFLDQTESYLNDINEENVANPFKETLIRFNKEFRRFREDQILKDNKALWAERAITWADILQIRAKL